jgi:hypothetical protein
MSSLGALLLDFPGDERLYTELSALGRRLATLLKEAQRIMGRHVAVKLISFNHFFNCNVPSDFWSFS